MVSDIPVASLENGDLSDPLHAGLAAISRAQHSFTDRAYATLKDAIVALALPPGTALSERALVERLQVSKTPVREALARLEREGFVATMPYRGTVVTTIGTQDIREIFDLRALIEGQAVFQATPALTQEDLLNLRAYLEVAESAARSSDRAGFSEANHQFHALFVARAWNGRLKQQLAILDAHALRIRTATAALWQGLGASLEYHWQLLDAVERRSAEEAQAVVQRDIREFEALLLANAPPEMLAYLGGGSVAMDLRR